MGIFTKKSKPRNIEEKQFGSDNVSMKKRPRICCIDIEKDAEDNLKENGFNIYSGTLGRKIAVPNNRRNDNHMVLLHYDFPVNLHEYDIIIVDLDNHLTTDYKSEDHIRDNHTGKSAISLLSTFPETIFDPKPFSSLILRGELKKIGNRPHMIIVFTTGNYSVEYESIKIHEDSVERQKVERYGIYSFFNNLPLSESKMGKEISVCNIRDDFRRLFESLLPNTIYNQTFFQPTKWKDGENIPDSSWVPLMKNSNNEIVSICYSVENFFCFYLPQFNSKSKFLNDFFLKIAPELLPELFPFSTTFSWTKHKDYWLPNHGELLKEKELIEGEYKNKLSEIDKKIDLNKKEFSFLHEIITESGDSLTNALIKFLEWLMFENVIDYDKQKKDMNIKEEDIQIDIEEGLLIVECKGIGGTSTDSDCSQISKVRHRRCKERNKFDVFALYIVNHQRYLPPLSRTNPPFSSNQIQDAINDERGLLSTWQLYNLYFDITNGVITKEEARESFLRYGLVDLKPKNIIFIDEPNEILKGGTVCIINLDNIELKIGENLIVESDGQFQKIIINGIQIDEKPVSSAVAGEIGLLIDPPIKKKSKLWKKSNS